MELDDECGRYAMVVKRVQHRQIHEDYPAVGKQTYAGEVLVKAERLGAYRRWAQLAN
jgi:hypothetical protein